MLLKLRQIMLERRIGDLLVGLLFGKGILGLLSPLILKTDLLSAYLYNRGIRDRLEAQAPKTYELIEIDKVVTGFFLIWAAALVYSWTHESQSQTVNMEDANG